MKIMKMTNQLAAIQKDITKLPGGEADNDKFVALQAKCDQQNRQIMKLSKDIEKVREEREITADEVATNKAVAQMEL